MDPRDSFGRFAVETEDADPTSKLSLYRSAFLLRRSLFVGDGFEWLDAGRDDVVAFANGAGVNVTVMRARPYVPPSWGDIVLRSDNSIPPELAPSTSAWIDARHRRSGTRGLTVARSPAHSPHAAASARVPATTGIAIAVAA